MEVGLITLILVILNLMATIWAVRVLAFEVQEGIERLDSNIAAAIKTLVDGDLLGTLEPPNPLQNALSQLIMQRVQDAPIQAARGPDGKFRTE